MADFKKTVSDTENNTGVTTKSEKKRQGDTKSQNSSTPSPDKSNLMNVATFTPVNEVNVLVNPINSKLERACAKIYELAQIKVFPLKLSDYGLTASVLYEYITNVIISRVQWINSENPIVRPEERIVTPSWVYAINEQIGRGKMENNVRIHFKLKDPTFDSKSGIDMHKISDILESIGLFTNGSLRPYDKTKEIDIIGMPLIQFDNENIMWSETSNVKDIVWAYGSYLLECHPEDEESKYIRKMTQYLYADFEEEVVWPIIQRM